MAKEFEARWENSYVSIVKFSLPEAGLSDWIALDIHNVPRDQFDILGGEEQSFGDFQTKRIELGVNAVTFYCNEPPVGESTE